MDTQSYQHIDSPAYVLHEAALLRNLRTLADVRDRAGVDIILAFKAFATWPVFDRVAAYLDGATASSLAEARLCYEEMGSRAHTYCVAYIEREFQEILEYSDHLTFNSLTQLERYKTTVQQHKRPVSMGLRVNPGYSEVETDLYNPVATGSRLGVHHSVLGGRWPEEVEGLHFHALCENDSYALEKTLQSLERHFDYALRKVKWVNMGGGHLITRKGYDKEHLIRLIRQFREKYDVEVVLEPGSAIAWQTGCLLSRVLDIVENGGIQTAILDISFTCHQPDTLEMPYRPSIVGAGEPKAGMPTYRLGGVSCLAGDFIPAYSFERPLEVGDPVIFKDMIHYTMVKTTMFNGVTHPDIVLLDQEGESLLLRRFGYGDFKGRLG